MADPNQNSGKDIVIDGQAPLDMARQAGFKTVRAHIDALLSAQTGTFPISTSTQAVLTGFNHRQTAVSYEWNRELFGYTFFTRPTLNMTVANILQDPITAQLLVKDKFNTASWIRHTLDPELSAIEGMSCPLVDDLNPFIPVLTNTIQSISGWPSLNASRGKTAPSRYGDTVGYIDGNIKELKQEFNLTATFQNMSGKFGLTLFFFWLYVASETIQGRMEPHFMDLVDGTMNYNTRIYRFGMDPFKRTIVDWTAAGVADILSIPIGDNYSFESTGVFNTVHDQYSIPFECRRYSPMDPRILNEFNKLTLKFNPKMSDATRKQYYQKIPPELLNAMNGDGYPWIDFKTRELEWWLPPDKFIAYRNRYDQVRGMK